MDRLRAAVDGLQSPVDRDHWPVPTYNDILFYVKRNASSGPGYAGADMHRLKNTLSGMDSRVFRANMPSVLGGARSLSGAAVGSSASLMLGAVRSSAAEPPSSAMATPIELIDDDARLPRSSATAVMAAVHTDAADGGVRVKLISDDAARYRLPLRQQDVGAVRPNGSLRQRERKERVMQNSCGLAWPTASMAARTPGAMPSRDVGGTAART